MATNQLVNDSTGDTFRLIEQPSGHITSVMLPANVMKEKAEPARPMVASPVGGPWSDLCGGGGPRHTPSETTGGAAAAAMRREDFAFTRKPPPPATVPRWFNTGKGAATSTSSPLHLHRPPLPPLGGQAPTAVLASIEEVLAQLKDILNLKGGLQRTSTEVAHHLQTRGPPIASKFWRLYAKKLAAA